MTPPITAPLTHAWQALYPPVQVHGCGWLDVGDGHQLYWEECGNPLGAAALFVHGGPGAGCTVNDRRWFDPQRYRIVLFDQRGCGRSAPLRFTAHNNTQHSTQHSVHDMELLRRHLGITQWLLFGGSWGSTLALAYAQQHAQQVSAMVLRGVFLGTADERDALYAGLDVPLMLALLASRDVATRQAAAATVLGHEDGLMASESGTENCASSETATKPDAAACAHATLLMHGAQHSYFLADNPLLGNMARLHHIPAVIVQGELDRVTPAHNALRLHAAWPHSQLHIVRGAGHASSHPGMAQLLVAATDQFARNTHELSGATA